MKKTTHVRTSKKPYYGAIILAILIIVYGSFNNNRTLSETASGKLGIVAVFVVLYSLFKILFGKGKIIMTEPEFKVQGYRWTNWNDLNSVYPFIEQDSENGPRHFIHFRLIDGTDLSVRSEYLEMSFEEIAALVNKYKMAYNNKNK